MKDTKDVVGLNVFSVEEGRILGRTAECVVDLATGQVLGLVVDVAVGVAMGIARRDITSVGQHAVMVGSAEVLKPFEELPELDAHRTGGPEAPVLITRSGQVLGALGTVRVDENCETVQSYEIIIDVVQAIADGPASLPIVEGTVHGRDAVILPDEAASNIVRPGGLRQRLEKYYDTVVEAASEVGQKVSTAAKKASQTAEERARSAKDAIEEKAKSAREAIEKRMAATPEAEAPAKKKAPAKKQAAKKKAAKKKAPAKKKRAAKKKAAPEAED